MENLCLLFQGCRCSIANSKVSVVCRVLIAADCRCPRHNELLMQTLPLEQRCPIPISPSSPASARRQAPAVLQ